MPHRWIVVGNLTEYNAAGRLGQFTPHERELWRRGSDELSDMAVFWGGDDKLLVAPSGVDHAWLSHVSGALRWRIDVVEPEPVTGSVLDDLMLDERALRELTNHAEGRVAIEAWGATAGVLRLQALLGAHGVTATYDGPPVDRLWTVRYLDGKLVVPDLAAGAPEIVVPHSVTAVDYDQMLGLVRHSVRADRGFAVKSNAGVGGFGTFLAPPSLVARGEAAVVQELLEAMGDEPVFREGPFQLQDWVEPHASHPYPTFNGEVSGDGSVHVVGVGSMLVEEASYRGVAVGDVGLADEIVAETTRMGLAVGRRAAEIGYVGWFDVDFVRHTSGALYLTEVNARRTSPTHAYTLLDRWRALREPVGCVLTDDDAPVRHGVRGWADVAPAFSAEANNPGVVTMPTICRRLRAERPSIGVAVGGPTLDEARAGLDRLRSRLISA